MPWDALTDELNIHKNPNAWKGQDDDRVWWMRWRIKIKGWYAFGPLARQRWVIGGMPPLPLLAKWREYPIVLFGIFGPGKMRFEDSLTTRDRVEPVRTLVWYNPEKKDKMFLTRVQYYCRWHFFLQWPLYLNFHWYRKKEYVPTHPNHENLDGKLIRFYMGAKRDGTPVYWFTALHLGLNWG